MKKKTYFHQLSIFMLVWIALPFQLEYSDQYRAKITQLPSEKQRESNLQIEIDKNTFIQSFPQKMECRIPPSAELLSLEQMPVGYSANKRTYPGYPLSSDYSTVTSLCWNPAMSELNRASTAVYQRGYDYHTRYYPSCRYPVDTTITNRFQESLCPLPPVFEFIQGEPIVMLVTYFGNIIAWNTEKAYIKWSKQLPVAENIVSTLATYRYKNKIYLLFSTDRKWLYQLDMETGREERRISLEDVIQSPLQILETTEEILMVYKSEKKLFCWDVLHWKIVMERKEEAYSDLSPFLVQVGNQKCIIQPFHSGRILCSNLLGDMVWEINTQGELSQDLALLVRDGNPWLVAVTDKTEKAYILLVQATTGLIYKSKILPGHPISPVVFEPASLSVSVIVKTKDSTAGFFSSDLDQSSRKDTWLAIPLQRCLAFYALHLEQEPSYLILNEKLEWMVVEKGIRKLSYPYPRLLSKIIPEWTSLHRISSAFIHGAVLVNLGASGFIMIGKPVRDNPFASNESRHSGVSRDETVMEPPYSNQSDKRDMNTLPDFSQKKTLNMGIPHYNDQQPLLNPIIWVDNITGQTFGAIPRYISYLSILDDQLKERLSIWLSGMIYTEPILEQHQDGHYTVWAITGRNLVEVSVSPDLKEYSFPPRTLAMDTNSTGGSFFKCSNATGFDLIWVDGHNQLTVFSMPEENIRFKEPVDSKNIALQSWDGEKYLFCGSKVIRLRDGEVIFKYGIPGSASTVIAFQGRLHWIQSTEDDIICRDGMKDEIIWTVRRLWCKSHCFFQSNPSVYGDIESGIVVVADYNRILSIDLSRGYIRWSYPSRDDIFLSQPTIIRTPTAFLVYAGSLRGKLYALHADSGNLVRGFPLPLPGKEESREIMKGASTPILTNGTLWIQRKEYGLVQFGSPTPSSLDFSSIRFRLQKKIHSRKNFSCWIRSIVYWETFFSFSNRLKLVW
ncbi:MAG: PQQ-binding-like beta-propeller repeat protein [Caldisericia bacterium]|nr:PQQ-binding-like beta-propeller repeat protein [Caldisericia bacterium]